MAVTTPTLSPLHTPQSGNRGLALHAGESAYPGLWDGHIASVVPCLFGWGSVMPAIGDCPEAVYNATRGNRSWGVQQSGLYDMSPIGEGINHASGGDIHTKAGYRFLVPWDFRDSNPAAPHSYTMVIKITATAGAEAFQYLYANNPRLTGGQNFKGEIVAFNNWTFTPQLWSGGNIATTTSGGNWQWLTQDNTIAVDQWHSIAMTVIDWETDVRMAIDGEFYPPSAMVTAGSHFGAPVYVSPAAIRMGYEIAQETQDLSWSLFQVWNRPLTDHEMVEWTADPCKMFERRRRTVGKAPAAATREFHMGKYSERSRIAYAG